MNACNPVTIVSLPLSEKKTISRKKSGYNVYVSWFYLHLKLLEEEEKESYLISSCVWAIPANSMSYEDSTRTPPKYRPHHVKNAAARIWRLLDGKTHAAW
eukprot:9480686-Ditylum_brightwellii.AAC.1